MRRKHDIILTFLSTQREVRWRCKLEPEQGGEPQYKSYGEKESLRVHRTREMRRTKKAESVFFIASARLASGKEKINLKREFS